MSDPPGWAEAVTELRQRWERDGAAAAVEAARGRLAAEPGDPWLRLLLGRMLLAAGVPGEGVGLLLAAAREPATRAAALVSLAPAAEAADLERTLVLLEHGPAGAPVPDDLRYAHGLALWRAGETERALAVWSSLSATARQSLGTALDEAAGAHAARLLRQGEAGEALAAMEALQARQGAALRVTRAAAATTARRGHRFLARRALRHLDGCAVPPVRAMRAALEAAPAERRRALVELGTDDRTPPPLRARAVLAAAADLALAGRLEEALGRIPPESRDPDAAGLRVVLRALVAGGQTPPAAGDCDWRRLRQACAGEPELLAALVAAPPAGASTVEQASFWAARGEAGAAWGLLAEEQRRRPDDPVLARNLAVLAYVRAMSAAPRVDAGAWRDAIAQIVVVLDNPPWLQGWVRGRLAVYGGRDQDAAARAEELKADVLRLLDRRLLELETAVETRGEAGGVAEVRRLRVDLARERRATAAMRELGRLVTSLGEPWGVGPLFAERAGLVERVRQLFATLGQGRRGVATETLADLIRSCEEAETAGARPPAPGPPEPAADTRRWFSELGHASAWLAEGNAVAAQEAALQVLARWSGPDAPAVADREAPGPGTAGLADVADWMRAEAATVALDATVAAFREQLARADFDMQGVAERMRRVMAVAGALGREHETELRLARLVLGKRNALLGERAPRPARLACDLMRAADAVGLAGLEEPRARALGVLASLLRARRQYRQAAECCEEAARVQPDRQVLASNAVGALLEYFDQLRGFGRGDEAREVLDRALQAATEAAARFPGERGLDHLPHLVRAVGDGRVPISDVLRAREPEVGVATPPPLGEEAQDCVRRCTAAWRARDLEGALAEARGALAAAPDHPAAAALVVGAALELARQPGRTDGQDLFELARETAAAPAARYPTHERLQAAVAMLERERVMHYHRTALEELHRKGLLLRLEERWGEAIRALKVVFALAPTPDVEVCALLAECLVEEAARGSARKGSVLRQSLRTAEKVLTIWRELAPEHPSLERVRRRAEEVRRSGDGGCR